MKYNKDNMKYNKDNMKYNKDTSELGDWMFVNTLCQNYKILLF
jgi:hypothetical protein